jgi:lipoyl(octanoyl) transferase
MNDVMIRQLGLQEYQLVWQAMQQFTNERTQDTADEIWLVEHPPVFTQGQNGKAEHILHPNNIPVIKTDRGGQVTYHGPGQLVVYTLVDLKRKKLTVRALVTLLEQSVIDLISAYQESAYAKSKAPGVYMDNKKICSVGLRIRQGCSFHGLALNVAMDLTPFTYINPCGFAQLEMTQLSFFKKDVTVEMAGLQLTEYLIKNLGYNGAHGKKNE